MHELLCTELLKADSALAALWATGQAIVARGDGQSIVRDGVDGADFRAIKVSLDILCKIAKELECPATVAALERASKLFFANRNNK